jgi:hypothetical protein
MMMMMMMMAMRCSIRNLRPRASLLKKKKMTAPERDRMMSKLIGQSDNDPNWQKHFSKSDVVCCVDCE